MSHKSSKRYLILLLIPILLLISVFIEKLINKDYDELKKEQDNFITGVVKTDGAIGILNICIIGPIKEELIFRGPVYLLMILFMLFNKYLRNKNRLEIIDYAICISAGLILNTIWANGHLLFTPIFVIGCMLLASLLITKSMIWPIGLHIALNTIVVLRFLFYP